MVLVCLPSDALLQHLPTYLGFSYLGRGVSLHGCSSRAQLLLLTLDEGYLLTTAPRDLKRGISPLGPPELAQPLLLWHGVAPHGGHGVAAPDLRHGVAPLGHAKCAGCSPIIYLRPNYGGGNEDIGDLLQKARHVYLLALASMICMRGSPRRGTLRYSRGRQWPNVWNFIGLRCKPSYSASFLHLIFLLHYFFLI